MEIEKLRLSGEELSRLGLEPSQLRCRICALTIADAQLAKVLWGIVDWIEDIETGAAPEMRKLDSVGIIRLNRGHTDVVADMLRATLETAGIDKGQEVNDED